MSAKYPVKPVAQQRPAPRTGAQPTVSRSLEVQEIEARGQAERALFDEKDKLEQLLEHVNCGLFLLDDQARVIYANRLAEKWFGPLEEQLGRHCWEVLQQDNPEAQCAGMSAIRTGRPARGSTFATLTGGEKRFFYVVATPVFKESGELAQVTEVIVDITEHERAEEQLRTWAEVFRCAGWGIAIGSPDGKVFELVNSAFAEMHGYTAEEMTGMPVASVFAPASRKNLPRNVRLAHKKGHHTWEDRHIRRDGTEFPVVIDAACVLDETGAVKRRIVNVQDVTRLKQAQELSSTLADIDAAIHSTLEFDRIMEHVVTEAGRVLGCDGASLMIREGEQWRVRYGYNLPRREVGRRLAAKQVPDMRKVLRSGKTTAIRDVRGKDKVRLLVPLQTHDNITGVIRFGYQSSEVAFTDDEMDFANRLATFVSSALENARLYKAQQEVAEAMQEPLLKLPKALTGVEYGHFYHCATEHAQLGGDFYDLFELQPGEICCVMGDVSGKGPRAAALTKLVKSAIRAYAYLGFSPSSIIKNTNDTLIKALDDSPFVTMFVGRLNTGTGQLSYANAGHPPPIVLRAAGEPFFCKTTSLPILVSAEIDYPLSGEQLYPGDSLVLYTDGITEARQGKRFFGEKRLVSLLSKRGAKSAKHLSSSVFDEVIRFSKGRLRDDAALLTITLKAG